MYYVAKKIMIVSVILSLSTNNVEATQNEFSRIHFFNEKEKELILDFHNTIRKEVANGSFKAPAGRINPVEWDEGLADFARYSLTNNVRVSNHCPRPRDFDTCWYHGLQVDRVGRNVAYSSRARLNDTLRIFWRPHAHYRYGKFSGRDLSGMGLFTQIIWADTKKIGCALLKSCQLNNESLFAMLLCNYAPNGNIIGEFPYYTNELDAQEHEAMERLTLNSCQEKEYDEDNFSRLKNSLIHPVYKAYHNLSKVDLNGPDLYEARSFEVS
uniref:SCP domain-containing protein n=1 Tax=Romanomermis culicivorax TaxID=13658 RepID=A0A915INN4_ROMCU